MSGTPCTPARGLAGAAAALVLPGPSGLSRQQLEVIYDAVADPGPGPIDDRDDSHHGWCLDDDGEASDLGHLDQLGHVDQLAQPVVPCERDLVWWGWCAEQVAAGGPTAADPVVAAGAGCHWQHQRALAAARGRAAIAEADAAAAGRAEQAAAFSAFTTWLAGVDEDTRAQVGSAAAERAAIATAAAVRDDLRAAQVSLGRAGAAQLRGLAALAPLYAAALDPAVVSVLDVALDLGRLQLLGAVDDLVAELAPTLRWSEYTTALRVRLAPRLVALLPHTMARLEGGDLDLARALLIAERTERADAGVARRVDELVCGPDGSGVGLNATALGREVDKVVAAVDAAAVKERSRRKTAARGTAMKTLGEGISPAGADRPRTPAVAGLHRQLTALATANRAEAQQAAEEGRVAADGGDPYAIPGVDVADPADAGNLDALLADERTLNAHRFDAAVSAVALARPADGSPRPSVGLEVLVSLPGAVGAAEDPGWLVGYGWLPGWLVRQGLSWAGCRLRRVLSDPYTGDLITVDGHTYPASWLHGRDPGTDDGSGHGPDDPGPDDPGPDDPGPDGSGPDGSGPGGSGPGGSRPGDTGSSSAGSHHDARDSTGSCGAPPDGGGSSAAEASAVGVPAPSSRNWGAAGGGSGRFRGLPVQQLPPPRTEDDVLGTPLTDAQLADLADGADAAGDGFDDPCARGACVPVDPVDCPLHAVGGGRYAPGAAQARTVRWAWGVCTGPGSTVAASACDLDHVIAYRADGSGGSTCSCNVEPKSRRWHLAKHATNRLTWRNPSDPTDPRDRSVPWTRRWAQWRCDHGSSHWVSPLGQSHHTRSRPIAEPAGPYRRLVAPLPHTWVDAPGHRDRHPRQRDEDVTSVPFPDHPTF